ncbi:MAG: pyridoxine 5'-phosphate synthase, partial [Candidatus Omnitrophica bacterium]|nr:pyridoxine 5'-phosphate synthase [Candidatus Omnitrophota bacterium]
RELAKIKDMTRYARGLGLTVNAGHGLKYHNTRAIARIPGIEELNIGHSIISRAVFVGLEAAVKEMVKIIKR